MKDDPDCPMCNGTGIRSDEFGPKCVYQRTELLLAKIRHARIVEAERAVMDSLDFQLHDDAH